MSFAKSNKKDFIGRKKTLKIAAAGNGMCIHHVKVTICFQLKRGNVLMTLTQEDLEYINFCHSLEG